MTGNLQRIPVSVTRSARIEAAFEQQWNEPVPELAVAFAGGDEGKARAERGAAFLLHTAQLCPRCQHVFADGEIVYRRKVGWGGSVKTLCADCASAPTWGKWGEPQTCAAGCGVLVVSPWRWDSHAREYVPTFTACSTHCDARAAAEAKRRSRERRCDDCGHTFDPTRADARYCSNACRQHAYRRRRATR